MMINVKRAFSVILCVIFMLALQVQAAWASDEFETVSVEQNIESGIVTLTCQLKEGFASERVTFLILRPGKTAADIDDKNPATFLDVVCHFDEKKVDENGKAVFSFSLDADAKDGKYVVSVGGTHVEVADATKVLDYTNVHDGKKLEQINQATTPDAMRAVITEDFYALDLDGYAKLSSQQEEKLIGKLCSKAQADGFGSISEYAECFNGYTAVALLNDSQDKDAEKSILESKSAVLGLDGELAQQLGEADVFDAFAEVILAKSFTEPQEVQEAYIDTLLNLCVKNSKWSELYDRLVLLSKNGADIDLEPYEKIKDEESAAAKAMQALVGKDVHIKTFDAALREAVGDGSGDFGSKDRRPSGGGGGGGTGGAGLSAGVPAIGAGNENAGESNAEGFTDLGSVPWASEAVAYLKEQGIVSGKSDGLFDPSAPVTREEFVKMLVLSFHIEEATTESRFSDVSPDSWYYPYINSAYHAGLIKGISDDVFGVGDKLTREQLAAIIYRAMGMTENTEGENLENESPFQDYNDVSEYAKNAVSELYKKGVVSGKDNERFAPKDFTTRAETAKILYEVIKGGR